MEDKRQQKTLRIAEPEIRTTRDLLDRIESNPASAAAIVGMDKWQRWMLDHGVPLVTAGLDEWEVAVLECIVRHTPASGRVPQAWLFTGGPDDDPRLRLEFLSKNTRQQRLTRFIDKVHRCVRQLGLTFKVERAADCSATIYTSTSSVRDPRPSRPDCRRPLRAAAAQSRHLGRARPRPQVHAAGGQWRRRAHAV